jgi:hypothetical protein
MTKLETQIKISCFSAFIFFVVNMMRIKQNNDEYHCIEKTYLLKLTIIFCAISFLSMSGANIKTNVKLRHSIYGALIFYLLSSPAMHILINIMCGNDYSSAQGCPAVKGLILSAVIYCLFLIFMMRL